MANQKKAEPQEVPTVDLMGIQRVSKGFVPLFVQVRGDRVVHKEVLSNGGPVKKWEAEDIFRVEAVKRGLIS